MGFAFLLTGISAVCPKEKAAPEKPACPSGSQFPPACVAGSKSFGTLAYWSSSSPQALVLPAR